MEKPVVWLGVALRTPPISPAARVEAGVLLRRLQRGERLGLPHARAMPVIHRRAYELRIADGVGQWRIVYRIDEDAIDSGDTMRAQRRGRVAMDEEKRQRLEQAGWRVGTAAEFLGLSPEEAAYVDMKLSLGELLRESRSKRGWTQEETARHIGSSQSRVAKMEAADRSVSLDLLVRSLLKLGVCPDDLVGGLRGARGSGSHAGDAVTR